MNPIQFKKSVSVPIFILQNKTFGKSDIKSAKAIIKFAVSCHAIRWFEIAYLIPSPELRILIKDSINKYKAKYGGNVAIVSSKAINYGDLYQVTFQKLNSRIIIAVKIHTN